MRKILLISGIVVLVIAGVFYWYQTTQASVGSLNIYSGSADVIRAGETSEGRTGTAIKLNDSLKVKSDSRVSIVLKDGSVIRLEAGSEVEVAQLEYQGHPPSLGASGGQRKIKSAIFKLKFGRLWSHTEPIESGASYEVETPTIVAAIRGTSFNTDYSQAINKVLVYKHSIGVSLSAQTNESKTVNEGQVFIISDANAGGDFNKGPRLATLADQDDWIKFNITEDAKLDDSEPIITPMSSLSPSPSTSSKPSDSINPTPTSRPTTTPQSTGKKVTSLLLTSTNTGLRVGDSVLLKVEAMYSDGGKEQVGAKVTWSQNPSIGAFTSPGFFRGILEGATKVQASLDGVISNEVDLVVTKNKQLIDIEVSYIKQQPKQISGNYPTAQFKALAQYSDNSFLDVTSASNWTAIGSAEGMIDSDGFYVPRGQGSDRVTAIYNSLNGSTTINIP